MLVKQRFGTEQSFLQKANPDTQAYFGKNQELAVMGDFPTLNDLNFAYGDGFSKEWLIPHIDNLCLHTGAKNLMEMQQVSLAEIIATEYGYMKITEILLFFYRFKTGRYGRFYGSVDPMVITCALRDFNQERIDMTKHYEQIYREKRQEEERRLNPPVTREEWLRMKENKNKKP